MEDSKANSPSTVIKPPRLECPFIKEEISKLDKTFLIMVQCIQEAVQGLHIIKRADIVIAIGNTGAGKSTMLNSLVFGIDKLEMKMTDKKKKVIE